jgi:hypothetical protein
MMPPSDSPYELEVSRVDLTHALKIVARVVAKSGGDASLRLANSCLSIEAGNTSADVPARGTWPHPIFVGASWVRRLAKHLPAGDPVHLRVDAGRLLANRFSQQCWAMADRPPNPEPPEIDENLLILNAARILKPLLATREDLESVVAEAQLRGPALWRTQEKKMIALVARAWEILAPLGVETSDIRELVDGAVRNAWKGKGK